MDPEGARGLALGNEALADERFDCRLDFALNQVHIDFLHFS